MHAVHHSTIGAQDDGEARIDLGDKPGVLHDRTNRRREVGVEPVGRIDLANRVEWHELDRQTTCQLDQSIDVPCIAALVSRPKVILLAHSAEISHRSSPADARDFLGFLSDERFFGPRLSHPLVMMGIWQRY